MKEELKNKPPITQISPNTGYYGKRDKKGRIWYKFSCGIRAYQKQPTVNKNGGIADALAAMDAPGKVGDMTFKQLLDTTMRKKYQRGIIEMVLMPMRKILWFNFKRKLKPGWTGELLLSEFDGVELDFFALNPRWSMMLSSLKLSSGGMTTTSTLSDGGAKSIKKAPNGSAPQAVH